MVLNLASGHQQEEWWDTGWPTPEESTQPTVDLDFVGGGKGKAKGKGVRLGGKGSMSPMQMTMAAINASKGGGKEFNRNNYNNNKGGIK